MPAALALLVSAILWVPAAMALSTDAQQPIRIEGDDAEIDQSEETIIYTGSVEVVQGTLRVRGDRVVVEVNGDQVERITTMGLPARYQQELEDDQGVVTAHADSIIYHTARERVQLTGSAYLSQQGNQLEGESIHYDIVNGRVDASAADKDDRVKMVLEPKTTPGPTTDQ